MSERHAIYYAPRRGSAWHAFGCHWLGRDEITGDRLDQPLAAGTDLPALTEEPRRYGWHATLKAPFRLNSTPAQLYERLAVLARQLRPVSLGTLVPVYMDGFVALTPSMRSPAVEAVAALCVTDLDALRAPLTAEEMARRQPERLDARGRELLAAYGYPHVLERFRFHMTLTGRVSATRAGELIAHIAQEIAELNRAEPPMLDRLCVFREPQPGADFLCVHEVELGP